MFRVFITAVFGAAFIGGAWAQQCATCESLPPNCKIGDEGTRWIHGCIASETAEWDGVSTPTEHGNCIATVPYREGQVMLQWRLSYQNVNNGSFQVSSFSAGQEIDFAREIKESYEKVINLALKDGDANKEANLRNEMKYALSEALKYKGSHDSVKVDVQARGHGNVFNRKRGWAHIHVELLAKCIAPANLEEQLIEKYRLEHVASIDSTRAYFENTENEETFFHCVRTPQGSTYNFTLKANQHSDVKVDNDKIECCHSYTATPNRSSCYAIAGGKEFKANRQNATE